MMTNNLETSPSEAIAPARGVAIEKVKGLTQEQMIERYMFPRKPVVLQDASKKWSALQRWSPEFWVKEYGDKVLKIDGKDVTMREQIRTSLESTEEKPGPYYRNVGIEQFYPELRKDVYPVPELAQPNWLYGAFFKPVSMATDKFGLYHELFIGGAGKSFPYMHYDDPGTHTFIHQIWGRKLFVLFPPTDGQYLYPGTGEKFRVSRIKDALNVDLTEFPLFAKASPHVVEIDAGETMFIPCGWWHTAKMTSFSISIGTDCLNHTNWSHFYDYQSRKLGFRNKLGGRAFLAYLAVIGKVLKLSAPRRNPGA
jgi:histone arginine demethylase JMJD6